MELLSFPVLNNLCKQLYECTDQSGRLQAEQNLESWSNSSDCLRQCTLLLERGELPYTPLVASTTLIKLLNNKTCILTEQRLELSRFVLNQLASRATSFQPYAVTSLCQLFARITKLEWTYMDPETQNYPFREPIETIINSISLDGSAETMLAIQLLSLLVQDVNTAAGVESITKHRKSSTSFRDAYLFTIFEKTVRILEKVVEGSSHHQQLLAVTAILELCLQCLLFDFIGSLSDETSEDNYNVQVPTVWRTAFIDGNIVRLMFQLYAVLPQSASEKVLLILVQLASIRRTLFSGAERQAYLEQLVNGTKMIIENPDKLVEQGAFHEFCRLVARLKANYQLCELIKVAEYPAMIRLLARFTVSSLQMVDFSPNSTYYLLCFWHRMATSVPYIRTQDDHQLDVFCPEIVASFVNSRIEYADRVVKPVDILRDFVEDPLEDQASILQMLEQLITILRCDYEKTYNLLARHFDENAQVYLSERSNTLRFRVAEGRLVWIVTMMGTAIFGKSTAGLNDEHDKMDGELMARVLRLMRASDERLEFAPGANAPGNGNVRMEVAFIHVLENFRRSYIMDQISKMSAVYTKLGELVSISDESDVLGVIVQKLITNLKMWSNNDNILEVTLCLLKDLSLGYTAVRKLFRLPDIQMLLNNHTAEHFSFLGPSTSLSIMKHRTTFYEALTRLLTTDLNDNDDIFERFMQPLSVTVEQICAAFTSSSAVDQTQLKSAIIGMCRDLRGVAVACTSKTLFQILFDWMYPNVFNFMLRAVETWPEENNVTTPVLRLLSELSQNRQQRLKFEMTSCSAVLLFREVSKIIVAYGNRLLELPSVPKEDVYRMRFKNSGVVFNVLKMALVGAYVPFGVFRLYGDTSLHDSLDMFVRMFMAIPPEDFHSYTKIAVNYYHLLEAVCTDSMPFISRLEPPVFSAILSSVQHGVMSIDPTVITSACTSLDLILNYLYRRLTRPSGAAKSVGSEPDSDNCLLAVKAAPHLLSELLNAILSAMLFGEVKCQWSMSRPLLGLILLQEDAFNDFKAEIIRQQPADRQLSFTTVFNALMDGIERTLTVKNKDLFTQNLAKFRRDVVDIVKGKPPSPIPGTPLPLSGMMDDAS